MYLSAIKNILCFVPSFDSMKHGPLPCTLHIHPLPSHKGYHSYSVLLWQQIHWHADRWLPVVTTLSEKQQLLFSALFERIKSQEVLAYHCLATKWASLQDTYNWQHGTAILAWWKRKLCQYWGKHCYIDLFFYWWYFSKKCSMCAGIIWPVKLNWNAQT